MKQHPYTFYLAIILLAALIAKTSCKNEAGSATKISKGDTTKILGVYADQKSLEVKHDILFRIVNEYVNVDSSTKKLSWKTDSVYFYPRLDTLKDVVTKKPLVDSSGKVKVEIRWDFIAKNLVWDTGIRIDSAISRFQKYISKPDTTKKNNTAIR